MTPTPGKPAPADTPVRAHVYDGIQEYDQRLPNWWLLTFYGAIVFSIAYWAYYAHSSIPVSDTVAVEAEMRRIETAKLAATTVLDDPSLWKMSRNATMVESGKAVYLSTCASCHHEKLTGGIGPSLVDETWVHGSRPLDVHRVVNDGVLVKGMPAWGPVLGAKKIAEVTAYILSHHPEPQ